MRDTKRLLRVAISHGDICGISYELLLKVFSDERLLELFTPVLYASSSAERFWREKLSIEQALPWHIISSAEEAREGMVNVVDVYSDVLTIEPGQACKQAGDLACIALERATMDTLAGLCDVLVTAPINKGIMPRDKFPYAGHTEYLEDKASLEPGKSLMLLCAEECRVALVTSHIPISAVPSAISRERIIDKVDLMLSSLERDFGVTKPRVAVLALNPHAGDAGLIGDDEELIIKPAIQSLSEAGHLVFGPYAADGFWATGRAESFDAVLAMYHDQGLAPFKTKYMAQGVNTTLGLRIVRTSPDHGTGYDIAGRGIASEESLREAIYLALDIYRSRCFYDEATRNPLRRVYFNKGRDDEKLDFANIEEQY